MPIKWRKSMEPATEARVSSPLSAGLGAHVSVASKAGVAKRSTRSKRTPGSFADAVFTHSLEQSSATTEEARAANSSVQCPQLQPISKTLSQDNIASERRRYVEVSATICTKCSPNFRTLMTAVAGTRTRS
ncbi:unnamed protein product [Prorocentrum cordatum]|uniref:Uncharacterized protein n=1 Tax=Prorocentrum cordatum TaxID=2364126 RepID=A0ABN9RWC8_9DINO|nr:unnamed protein product [Polarella glacialis]